MLCRRSDGAPNNGSPPPLGVDGCRVQRSAIVNGFTLLIESTSSNGTMCMFLNLYIVFYLEPSSVVSEQLPFVPYILLWRILRDHPAHEEMGVVYRESLMREGVIRQILIALSSFGHPSRSSRATITSHTTERYNLCILAL